MNRGYAMQTHLSPEMGHDPFSVYIYSFKGSDGSSGWTLSQAVSRTDEICGVTPSLRVAIGGRAEWQDDDFYGFFSFIILCKWCCCSMLRGFGGVEIS
jgi:hypothetical protein